MKRVPSFIHGHDRLLEAGFRERTVIVLVGSSGTGKMTFTVEFADDYNAVVRVRP